MLSALSTPSILVVDDDPAAVQVLARMVADLGEVFVACDGAQALQVARDVRPDIVLLDGQLPDIDGLEVCQRLKAEAALADSAVIFVTARNTPDFEVSGFEAGAADFIAKPLQLPTVRARVRTQLRLKQMADELRRQAQEDALTGVPTRRRFDECFLRELGAARHAGGVLSVLMIDVDHFKAYNDHYGHPAGDVCLRLIAQTAAKACWRPGDLVARLGGEEFAMLLPDTPLAASSVVAQRLLDSVAELALPHAGVGPGATVGISIGASAFDGGGRRAAGDEPAALRELAGRLLHAADAALYDAKRGGRHRAVARPLDAVAA